MSIDAQLIKLQRAQLKRFSVFEEYETILRVFSIFHINPLIVSKTEQAHYRVKLELNIQISHCYR